MSKCRSCKASSYWTFCRECWGVLPADWQQIVMNALRRRVATTQQHDLIEMATEKIKDNQSLDSRVEKRAGQLVQLRTEAMARKLAAIDKRIQSKKRRRR